MSLDFHLDKIKDYENLCHIKDDEGKVVDFSPVTQSLVWACLANEMSGITEKNAEEFYRRMTVWIKVIGPFYRVGDKPVVPTFQDVLDHIGLWTNVKTESRQTWCKRLLLSIDCYADGRFMDTVGG